MRINQLGIVTLAGILVFLSAPAICRASDSGDAVAAVRTAVAAFNRGDLKGWAAACDSPASALDDIPPYHWQGPTACTDWVASFKAFTQKNKIASGTVVMGAPWTVTVTGNQAYIACPVTFHYNQNGKAMKETGSVLTVVLRKSGKGWRIQAWSWSQHS